MARLPNLPMRKQFAEGGTTTEDIPAQTGGAGASPNTITTDTEGSPTVAALSGVKPDQKIGLTEGEKITPQPLTMQSDEELQAINLAQADPVTKTTGATTGLEIPVPQVQATPLLTHVCVCVQLCVR